MAARHTRITPPRWLEHLLLLLLPPRNRDTVIGDLREVFCEEQLPQRGRAGATLWYARQVLSFLPHKLLSSHLPGSLLALLGGFTALCGLWLGAMGLLLRHPGYATGEAISATIVAQAVLTLLALRLRQVSALRVVARAGCLPLAFLAAMALRGVLRDGAHFEGYILLIALLLIIQAILTWLTLLGNRAMPERGLRPL